LLAPDFVSFTSAAGGPIHGPKAFREAYVMFSDAFEGFSTTIDVIVGEDNEVAVYGIASGKHTGAFMGAEPTGKNLEWAGIAIYRFNDGGLIDGRWQQIDGVALATQLGMIPS
jgi:predicted ester cyclase